MIIVDTREKKWEHIRSYFESNGINYEIIKLDSGDYMNTEKDSIVIDRKANLQELAKNLSKGDSNIMRFIREVRRAKAAGKRFIVLIEGTNCKAAKDVIEWKPQYGKVTGRMLYDKMFNLTVSHDVEWMFCKKTETARKIIELLEYENDS